MADPYRQLVNRIRLALDIEHTAARLAVDRAKELGADTAGAERAVDRVADGAAALEELQELISGQVHPAAPT